MSVCVYIDVNEGALSPEASDLHGAGVIDHSEPLDVGAGNGILALCKSSARVLNH